MISDYLTTQIWGCGCLNFTWIEVAVSEYFNYRDLHPLPPPPPRRQLPMMLNKTMNYVRTGLSPSHTKETDTTPTTDRSEIYITPNGRIGRFGVGRAVWLGYTSTTIPTPVLPCPFPFLLVFESDGDFDHRWYEKGIDEEDPVLL